MPRKDPALIYEAQRGKIRAIYELCPTELRVRAAGEDGFAQAVDLRAPGLRLAPHRTFDRRFWVGVAGLLLPLWTFGVVWWKEGSLRWSEFGAGAFFHMAFFVLGLVLTPLYARRLRGTLLTTDGRTGILVWEDLAQGEAYATFVAALQARVGG